MLINEIAKELLRLECYAQWLYDSQEAYDAKLIICSDSSYCLKITGHRQSRGNHYLTNETYILGNEFSRKAFGQLMKKMKKKYD